MVQERGRLVTLDVVKPGKLAQLHEEDDLPDRSRFADDPRRVCPGCGEFVPPQLEHCPHCLAPAVPTADDRRQSERVGVTPGEVIMLLAGVGFVTWVHERDAEHAALAALSLVPWAFAARILLERARMRVARIGR